MSTLNVYTSTYVYSHWSRPGTRSSINPSGRGWRSLLLLLAGSGLSERLYGGPYGGGVDGRRLNPLSEDLSGTSSSGLLVFVLSEPRPRLLKDLVLLLHKTQEDRSVVPRPLSSSDAFTDPLYCKRDVIYTGRGFVHL